jgi:phosphopantetheinyl transferase
MNLFWLEQAEADVPPENDWLTPAEMLRLSRMRFPKRSREWRLGRWTAKLALANYLGWPAHRNVLGNIEIRSAESGAPVVFVRSKPGDVALSISHRAGAAMCAIAHSDVRLGCDLEIAEPRCEAFVSDYFADKEQLMVASAPADDRSWLLALLWSAKESALKALHEGLRLDTRLVSVSLGNFKPSLSDGHDNWYPLQARCPNDQTFAGWWQHTGAFLRTVIVSPPSAQPISLNSLLNGHPVNLLRADENRAGT